MKKTLSLLLAYLFLLAMLPMGGVAAETMEPTVSQQAVSTDAVLEQVPATLRDTQVNMLVWWNPGEKDAAKAAAFEDATGIDVTYDTVTLDKYLSQQAMNIAAHKSSSIVAIINEWYPYPIVNRLVQPLSNVPGWDFNDDSVYATSMMDQFAYKGERYGIAVKGSSQATFHVMFFNKNILARCGVTETPYDLWKAGNWNWDTFLEIARKCTKPSSGLHGLTNISCSSWMLSAGQDFVGSDENGLYNNTNSPELWNAWSWNWDLINNFKVVDTTYTGQTPFFQGKAAMLGAGSYMMQADPSRTNYVPQSMKSDWGVVPFPSPAGMSVSACEGTVWGFGTGVRGSALQAAAWYLRYYLDDAHNPLMADFYPADHPECREVIDAMWEQPMQSYNSVGVLTCGDDEYTAWTIQYSLVDEADTKAYMKANLDQWYGVFDWRIDDLENQEGHECYYSYVCDPYCDVCGLERRVYHTYDGPEDRRCNVCNSGRVSNHHSETVVFNEGFENGLAEWQELGKNGTFEERANYSAKVLDVADSEDGKVLEFKLNYQYDDWGDLILSSDWSGIHLDGISVKPQTVYKLKVRYKIAPDAIFEYAESDDVNKMSGYLFIRGLSADGSGNGLGDMYDDTIASVYMMRGSKLEWRDDEITFKTNDSDKLGLDLRAVKYWDVPIHYYIDSIQLIEHVDKIDAGDVDGTGYVTLKDAAILQRYLNGWDVDIVWEAADVNGDSKLNVRDLGLLQLYLNNWDVELHQY